VTNTRAGLIAVVLTAALVSLSSIFSRFSYDLGNNPQTLILLRYLMFCPLCLLLIKLTGQSLNLARQQFPATYLAGFFYTLGSGSLLASMYFLPVSLAIVIFYTYPILTLAGRRLIDRQAPGLIEAVCFLLAFFGLFLALNISGARPDTVGVMFALTASASMSVSYLISDSRLKAVPSITLTFHLAVAGLILAAVLIITTRSFNPGQISLANIVYILGAILCFAFAFIFMFKGISLIGAVNTSMILNLEPVFTIALSVLLLGESLSEIQLIGAVLVIAAIVVVQLYQARKRYLA